MMGENSYQCIIVGGGIAGLQAAIQLGRYMHHVVVIDSDDGRSNACRGYHNLLGWPNGVSGETLRSLGKSQAMNAGIEFKKDYVIRLQRQEVGFEVKTKKGEELKTKTILLSTGIKDHIPPIEGIAPCLGISVYVCPDCDGYEVRNRKTIILGSGNTGAKMALTLTYWTNQIVFVNHERKKIDHSILTSLKAKGIETIEGDIDEVIAEDKTEFRGVSLKDGRVISGEKGFIAFGGNTVHSELAHDVGVERLENKHVLVDPRTKETNITNIWAAGDVVAHSEQVSIAMADGCQAAIWIHKRLLEMDKG
ncbi:pyridine nucleotide-disulfide oxidoreductase [Bacillus weihaiensis]|uniref:Pyridine nucleotide-disulfide oxidoreductase n=2 Tax=Bacillus weihaiensis TaxID=1547283 RepID=A0A1L3MLT3_9BACI|nr:pyridine nucleotide-disulfide oxidoreductase [Bacillus weihaiensis]